MGGHGIGGGGAVHPQPADQTNLNDAVVIPEPGKMNRQIRNNLRKYMNQLKWTSTATVLKGLNP